ncbi:MAG: zf-HC2 domain-containing protein [Candidatus Aminicenantes bacterium]|nr:zf-HC2 domain-containing protein [Candidatus Aminicenantes bacterium]
MNCEEARHLVTIEVFGNPDPDERAALEEHLRRCPDCARVFEKSPVGWEPFDVPDDIPTPDWERSWEVISGRALGRPRGFRLFGWPGKWAFAAASLVVVFILGFILGRRFLQPPSERPILAEVNPSEPASPFKMYAESLEPVLTDFLNRGEAERPQEIVELERRIIQSMLAETRLLQVLAEQSEAVSLQGFLEEMESLLVSLANLKPGDRDSADLLGRTIRDRQIRFKLRELSGVKITI